MEWPGGTLVNRLLKPILSDFWNWLAYYNMKILFTYWKEPDGMYLGHLNDFPEHWTQGTDFEDLKSHLQDLYEEFSKEDLPGIKHVAEL